MLLAGHFSFSKENFSFRKLLNKIHVSTSFGYGSTHYAYQAILMEGKANNTSTILFREGDKFYLYSEKPGTVYLVRWFDGSYIRMQSCTDWKLAGLEEAEVSVKFEGIGSRFPISFSSYVDYWERLRLGLGSTFFINNLGRLDPEDIYLNLGPYIPSQKQHYHLRPFILLGYKFFDNAALSMLLETTVGIDLLYAAEDERFTEISNLGAYNLGLTIEGHVSEYVRLFGRFSSEQVSGILGLPSGSILSTRNDNIVVSSERRGILFQLGISLNYPDVPRCTLPGCKMERKHKHGRKVYRGMSIFRNRDAQGRNVYKSEKAITK